jgi:hypothetical protein
VTDSTMMPAIRAAIKANEIGSADPYALSFAGKGNSGASFGIFQNDTAANSSALKTLQSILTTAALPDEQIARIIDLLGKPCTTNPLTAADEGAVNAALHSDAGKLAVDALDDKQLSVVCGYLDRAVQASKNPIEGKAQLGICMWCNMTGAPTTLLTWLGGSSVVAAGGKVDPPGNPASFDDLTRLLQKQTFFVNNPRNWQHFADSAAEGAELLPSTLFQPMALFDRRATMVEPQKEHQPVGLAGTESEFANALLAFAQKLTGGEDASAITPFPHGIGSIEMTATVEPRKVQFSLKITDTNGTTSA